MLNGRGHPTSTRQGLVVNGRSNHALAEADSSVFYGEYEQRLASELSELLKTGSAPHAPAASTSHAAGRDPLAPLAERAGLHAWPARPTALQQAAPGSQRTFIAARRPENDFAATENEDDTPLPFSWRHEPRAPQPNWLARQMRAGLLGLGAGLVVVLPAVAVLTGRLDAWLPSQSSVEIAAQAVSVAVSATERPAIQTASVAAPSSLPAPAAAVADIQRGDAATAMKTDTSSRLPLPTRSIGSIEPFPSAGAIPPPAVVAVVPSVPSPAEEAAGLLTIGLKLMNDGDIAGARSPLARAANIGSAEAMLALGETFDPNMLAAWAVRDVKSDVSTARLFYGRAAAAGLPRAKTRLDALN